MSGQSYELRGCLFGPPSCGLLVKSMRQSLLEVTRTNHPEFSDHANSNQCVCQLLCGIRTITFLPFLSLIDHAMGLCAKNASMIPCFVCQ
jgi:hypothetical protein